MCLDCFAGDGRRLDLGRVSAALGLPPVSGVGGGGVEWGRGGRREGGGHVVIFSGMLQSF